MAANRYTVIAETTDKVLIRRPDGVEQWVKREWHEDMLELDRTAQVADRVTLVCQVGIGLLFAALVAWSLCCDQWGGLVP